MSKLTYTEVLKNDWSEMSHAEARLVICRRVGLNTSPRSTFGKSDLNSIYRYLTGEFYYPRELYYTPDSPPTGKIRQAIAREVGLSYDPGPDWNRPFVLENVQKLAREIRNRDDKRQ